MTDTPRTNVLRLDWDAYSNDWRDGTGAGERPRDPLDLCDELERELAAANARIAELEKTIRAFAE